MQISSGSRMFGAELIWASNGLIVPSLLSELAFDFDLLFLLC